MHPSGGGKVRAFFLFFIKLRSRQYNKRNRISHECLTCFLEDKGKLVSESPSGLKSKCSSNSSRGVFAWIPAWRFWAVFHSSCGVCLWMSSHHLSFPCLCFIAALGADSNSEYSSGSGILLSDSRETSSVASSVRSVPVRDQGSGDNKGRSSRGAQFKEPKWEWSGGVQKGRGQHGEPKEESLEVSTEKLWGFVGEEE